MNIDVLKNQLACWPDEISAEQFGQLLAMVESLRSLQRLADEVELQATLAKAAELQAKLGVALAASGIPVRTFEAPKPRRQEPDRDLTDADMGYSDDDDDGVTASSFRAELKALRAHNIEKRRRMQ